MISQGEIDYYRSKLKGPDVDTRIDTAVKYAGVYVQEHAANLLPMIQSGVARAVFLYIIQDDPGERELLRISIDNLIQLGRGMQHDRAPA